MQGKVNRRTIDPFDSTEEGFRNFILFTFHPYITDTVGVFHMLRQFLVILDSILAQDGNTGPPISDIGPTDHSFPPSVENLVPTAYSLKDWVPLGTLKEYIYPRKSALEPLGSKDPEVPGGTHVLRGWLSESETQELLAIMEEDDSSLHGNCF